MNIKKILVANRGEIALRIMRSAREMGIQTVAVYSVADRLALHVRYADEAVCIGGPASSDSYLRMDKIIDAAKQTGADAIHPGYGFLSENAKFSQLVTDSGLIFIGPSATSITQMGSKIGAKQIAKSINVPLVPGLDEAITDIPAAKIEAAKIGYPVLIKASAGGGGKGMRIVENEEEFEEQMQRAVSEAISAFGDGAVFIEKYISSPKHIEIQVLADTHGNTVYLFERECSIQRRHQKVVEEAPAALMTPELRARMGECAVKLAKACGYYGAGTVEFVTDSALQNFYFLEMNTRLQVEHPVTEFITGVDLVKEQIKVAQGEKLAFTQDDLKIQGHAVEVRVYAEDPKNNFLPDIGNLQTYIRPQGSGVRVDDGFEQGMDIPIYYDPMIAKLIAYGKDRAEAIERLIRAIDEYKITGIQTTLPFCRFVLKHESFRGGAFDTKFVQTYFSPESLNEDFTEEEFGIAAKFAAFMLEKKQPQNKATQQGQSTKSISSAWKSRMKN